MHTGAFDPFAELIPLARAHGAWVHVDGAFGLWAAASPALRPLMAGAEDADSWTTDAHKTLNVPYDCGMAIVRDPGRLDRDVPHRRRLPRLHRARPVGRDVPSCRAARAECRSGRRCAASARAGVAALVDRLHGNAVAMAEGLAGIPGVTVANEVPYTQVMFRLDDDDATRALGAAILEEGTASSPVPSGAGTPCCGARCRRGRRRPTTSSGPSTRSAVWPPRLSARSGGDLDQRAEVAVGRARLVGRLRQHLRERRVGRRCPSAGSSRRRRVRLATGSTSGRRMPRPRPARRAWRRRRRTPPTAGVRRRRRRTGTRRSPGASSASVTSTIQAS